MTVAEMRALLDKCEDNAEVLLQDGYLEVFSPREVSAFDGDDLKRMSDNWGPVLHPAYLTSLARGAQTVVVIE